MALCCGFLRSAEERRLYAVYYNQVEIFLREIIDLTKRFDQWPKYLSEDMKLNGNMRDWTAANPLNLRGNDYWLVKYSQACRVMWAFWNFNGGFRGYDHYNLIPLGAFAFGGLSATFVFGVQMNAMISLRDDETLKKYRKMQAFDICLKDGEPLGFRWKFLETGIGSAQSSFMAKLYTPHQMLSGHYETVLISASMSNHRLWDRVLTVPETQEPEQAPRPDGRKNPNEKRPPGWDSIREEYAKIKDTNATHDVMRIADASEMSREAREMKVMEGEVRDTAFDLDELLAPGKKYKKSRR